MGPRVKRRSIKLAESAITCKKEVEFIADYLSSDLDLQQSKAFENHLKICGDCITFLETYKKTIELTRAFLMSPAQPYNPRTWTLRPSSGLTTRR